MIPFYADENVDGAIISGLRERDCDVLTALQDGHNETDDRIVLDRAGQLRRLLLTQDQDLLRIANERQKAGIAFIGVIFAAQDKRIGRYIDDLVLISEATTLEEHQDKVTYLPL